MSRDEIIAMAREAGFTAHQADSAPLAAADTVVLEAALRAIHQAIDLIGEPDTERLRTVRRVLRGAVVVAEDSTAPQADSQPALDEAVAMSRTRDLAEAGRWPSDWVEAYRRGYSDRATRAPADIVTAPVGGAAVPADWPTDAMIEAGRKVAATHGRLLGSGQSLWHVFREMFAAAPTPPAQAADSVLEDAARLDWLDEDDGDHVSKVGKTWYTRPAYGRPYRKHKNLRAAIDAARAAQEGKNHDN